MLQARIFSNHLGPRSFLLAVVSSYLERKVHPMTKRGVQNSVPRGADPFLQLVVECFIQDTKNMLIVPIPEFGDLLRHIPAIVNANARAI